MSISVSYRIKQNYCITNFTILINEKLTSELIFTLTEEISNHIGYGNQITKKTQTYIDILTDLRKYI